MQKLRSTETHAVPEVLATEGLQQASDSESGMPAPEGVEVQAVARRGRVGEGRRGGAAAEREGHAEGEGGAQAFIAWWLKIVPPSR